MSKTDEEVMKDRNIKEMQEDMAKLEKENRKLSKRNKKLETDLEEALKNLAIADAEKAEKTEKKATDRDILQNAISYVYDIRRKRDNIDAYKLVKLQK